MSDSLAETRKRAKQSAGLHHGVHTEDIPLVLSCAVKHHLLSQGGIDAPDNETADPVALFYDLDAFDDTLQALSDAFPVRNWRHCLAVKANPLLSMLKLAVEKGFGLECASINEVELSVRAQCPPEKIVYDSPCKTMAELRRALQVGVQINCDSLDEIDRVAKLVMQERVPSKSIVGVRINPLLGMGNIKSLSVSDATSKFGIPLTEENKIEIKRCFEEYPFLNGLHVHVGSQGCSLEMLSSGALSVYRLAEELGGPARVKVLDVGGGLPTNFSSDETTPTFSEYSHVMKKMVPQLFASDCAYTCVTEFGRAVQAKLGFVASACELVKEAGGRRIAVVHVGSDMFVRTCYCPNDFPLRVDVVCGKVFRLKSVESKEDQACDQNVVGPLCFGGDKICEARRLPRIEEGDMVVVRDSGANCLSLWSRHCSRNSLAVFGYRRRDNGFDFIPLRKREGLDQLLRFWE